MWGLLLRHWPHHRLILANLNSLSLIIDRDAPSALTPKSGRPPPFFAINEWRLIVQNEANFRFRIGANFKWSLVYYYSFCSSQQGRPRPEKDHSSKGYQRIYRHSANGGVHSVNRAPRKFGGRPDLIVNSAISFRYERESHSHSSRMQETHSLIIIYLYGYRSRVLSLN